VISLEVSFSPKSAQFAGLHCTGDVQLPPPPKPPPISNVFAGGLAWSPRCDRCPLQEHVQSFSPPSEVQHFPTGNLFCPPDIYIRYQSHTTVSFLSRFEIPFSTTSPAIIIGPLVLQADVDRSLKLLLHFHLSSPPPSGHPFFFAQAPSSSRNLSWI